MIKRLLSFVVLFFAVIFLPFWVYILMLVLALIFFRFYWEGVIIAFFIDVIYGISHETLFFSFPFALGAVVILILILPIRDKLRLNA